MNILLYKKLIYNFIIIAGRYNEYEKTNNHCKHLVYEKYYLYCHFVSHTIKAEAITLTEPTASDST